MTAKSYHYLVEVDGPPGTLKGTLYDGTDAADAMAAWSRAVTAGKLYVTLEALRDGTASGFASHPEQGRA